MAFFVTKIGKDYFCNIDLFVANNGGTLHKALEKAAKDGGVTARHFMRDITLYDIDKEEALRWLEGPAKVVFQDVTEQLNDVMPVEDADKVLVEQKGWDYPIGFPSLEAFRLVNIKEVDSKSIYQHKKLGIPTIKIFKSVFIILDAKLVGSRRYVKSAA